MATEEDAKPSPTPPYPEMILAAIEGLGDKNGSNKSSISKYIEGKYGELPPSHAALLTAHLARMKESGELIFLRNNYFRANAPGAPPKRGRGRPPKAKNPLEAAVKQATAGMPMAGGRPPKKAKTEGGASPAPKPAPKPAPTPAPAGDGSAPVKRGRGRPPKGSSHSMSMATRKVAATSFFDDDMSVSDIPILAKAGVRKPIHLSEIVRAPKRSKSTLADVPSRPADKAPQGEKAAEKGKSRFYRESIQLMQAMVDDQLLGYDRIVLGCHPGDYVNPSFYTGLSSSSEMNDAREESYRIASSLGAASDVQLMCRFDCQRLGILCGEDSETTKFIEFAQKAFVAPEVERDLLKADSHHLRDALSFHLASAMVLARSQSRQSDLFCRQVETEKRDKDRRLKELEEENEALEKKAEDEKNSRRAAQRDAENLRKELVDLKNSRNEELTKVSTTANDLVLRYLQCLQSLGVNSEGPSESNADARLDWLRTELDALEGHMALSRDYAAVAGIKAIGHSLVDAGCTHISDLVVKDVDSYWRTPEEAKVLGKKFFEEFWLSGGKDMSLLQAAMSRGQTPEEKALIKSAFVAYISERQRCEADRENENAPASSSGDRPESSTAGAAREGTDGNEGVV